ncbi:hypothetical protein JHK82_055297 [Glycine max]|nr:hypothetical protein JHK86_055136 [Glycine max]KAG4917828.1 hypothetical protein JHK85_056109 [Glycine max]KAG5073928.1 hypothetical protein JHK84_055159 [Glycine max]KAG5076602.1 hypothetical protein JHK82_055297 [Glycine max]
MHFPILVQTFRAKRTQNLAPCFNLVVLVLSGTSLYSFAFPSRFVSRSSITLINCTVKALNINKRSVDRDLDVYRILLSKLVQAKQLLKEYIDSCSSSECPFDLEFDKSDFEILNVIEMCA